MRLTKGFMAIFAPAESLPSPATLPTRFHKTYIRPVPQSVTCSSKAKSDRLRKEEAFQDLTCPLFLFWNECTLSEDKYSGEEKKDKEQGIKEEK